MIHTVTRHQTKDGLMIMLKHMIVVTVMVTNSSILQIMMNTMVTSLTFQNILDTENTGFRDVIENVCIYVNKVAVC